MFLFIYVDIYQFYVPGFIDDLRAEEIAGFEITQMFLLGSTILMAMTSLMVFLSLALDVKANRIINVTFGLIWIGILIGSLFVGDSWAFYYFDTIVTIVVLSLIVWYAWKWPTAET
jgi:hypothetical protein